MMQLSVILISLIITLNTMVISLQSIITHRKCTCQSTTFSCRHLNLSESIPRSTCKITMTLEISNSNIACVTDLLFNLTDITNISTVILTRSNVQTISANAFNRFSKLQTLNLRSNNLTAMELTKAFSNFSSITTLREINLDNNPLADITKKTFLPLEKINLESLTLSDTGIKSFSCRHFSPLENLTLLHLDKNKITSLEVLCSTQSMYTDQVHRRSDISENFTIHIKVTPKHKLSRSCLCQLRILRLDANPIAEIGQDTFATLKNLQYLYLNDIKTFRYLPALRVQNLHTLELSNSNVSFNPTARNKRLFVGVRSLKLLSLKKVSLENWNENDLEQLFWPLEKLQNLKLGHTNLTVLPKKLSKTVEYASFSGNKIISWMYETFENVTSLRDIFLNGNLIDTLNETAFSLTMHNSRIRIDLSNNPFHCDCDIVWFIIWAQTHFYRITGYNKYSCGTPLRLHGETLQRFKEKLLKSDCRSFNVYVIVAIVLCIIIVVVTVLATILEEYLSKCRSAYTYNEILS